jgi:hypothetical protein
MRSPTAWFKEAGRSATVVGIDTPPVFALLPAWSGMGNRSKKLYFNRSSNFVTRSS